MSDAEQKITYSTDIESLAKAMRTMSYSERCKAIYNLADEQHSIGFKNGKWAMSSKPTHQAEANSLPPEGCICASFWTVRQAHKSDCPLANSVDGELSKYAVKGWVTVDDGKQVLMDVVQLNIANAHLQAAVSEAEIKSYDKGYDAGERVIPIKLIDAVEFRREQYGWSAKKMAAMLDMNNTHYSEFIHGKRGLPIGSLRKAYAIGIPASILLADDIEQQLKQTSDTEERDE